MSDFWVSSGHHLLDRAESGGLVVTDEFLRAYLARPEIVPPEDACLVERAIYDRLRRAPRAAVQPGEVADMADRDARENWRHWLALRDTLIGHESVEAAYLTLIRSDKVTTPPLFLNQLVNLILRNALDASKDAFVLRAAELLFRAQRLTVRDGVLLLADEELVDGSNVVDHASPLVAVFGDARARDLDILTAGNAPAYWGRSDAFDMVLDFRHGHPARAAFARVLEVWVRHMLGIGVTIEPVERLTDESWHWFVGLDQEATRIGNALWKGEEPADDGLNRIVAIFRLDFEDDREMLPAVAGKSVVLILATTTNRIVRVKPQNLIVGLPLRSASGPS
ncbi:MAG: DUF6352 family protein [Hyphomicrobiaceae bacterium]|jgi:hypothetical protein